jgi:serine/threonine-protein kinase
MSPSLGTRLGSYEVVSLLGRGGMGEVYRARDLKLHRDVALKILPPAFERDPERLARFKREAFVLATLNHPHIGQIYGFEEDGNRQALVLELVEGLTLADRIAQGPIPLDEALAIARQIVEALGAAHEAGVVHRDLKPANIKLRPDGTIKVLDFGLAKAVDPTSGDVRNSPTITSPAGTGHGVILGTASYMAPEQARGRPVDKRADIWAFGVVLFEMVTGRRLFAGEDVSDTLAAILKTEPDLTDAPPALRRLIRKCLEKDPRRRLHDIQDAWDLIDDAASPAGGAATSPRSRPLTWVAAGLAGLSAAFFAGWMLRSPTPPTADTRRFHIALPESLTLPAAGPQVVLSPDGRVLVFRAEGPDGVVRLYRRALTTLDVAPIEGTENVRYQGPPFFSPDGQWLAFLTGNQLKKVNMTGGEPQLVAVLPRGTKPYARPGWNWGGGAWGTDGRMVLALYEGGLVRVPADGGEPEVLAESEGFESWYQRPQILGNGQILFTAIMTMAATGDLRVLDIASRRTRTLIPAAAGWVAPSGHLIYLRAGTLWATRFDRERLEVVGDAAPVEQGVRSGGVGTTWVSIADDGTLAYVTGPVLPQPSDTLVWVDRRGTETPIANLPSRFFNEPRLSPGDERIAVTVRLDGRPRVWVWDFAGLSRLTERKEMNRFPVWTPDGKHLVFSLQAEGREVTYWQPWDRPAEAKLLTAGSDGGALPVAFSPDGTRLVTQTATFPPATNVFRVKFGAEATATLEHSFPGGLASVSRDGRWIAYQSAETGQNEIFVRPFPEVGSRGRQVSTKSGTRPVWSRATDELFFLEGLGTSGRLMAIGVSARMTLDGDWTARPLFPTAFHQPRVFRNFDVSSDGARFLMTKPVVTTTAGPPPEIVVVQNWLTELHRALPVN